MQINNRALDTFSYLVLGSGHMTDHGIALPLEDVILDLVSRDR